MKQVSLILIDPQVGFCSPSGSLGLNYGSNELREIRKTIPNIKKALKESQRRHLVWSEYSIAQFTDGNKSHQLANLCVPNVNADCHVIDEFASFKFHSSSVKHEPSALSSEAFCHEIKNDIKLGIESFVIAGFLLEHCVKATAEDLNEWLLGSGAKIFVCSDLSASRSAKYESGEIASTISTLSSKGIQVTSWQNFGHGQGTTGGQPR